MATEPKRQHQHGIDLGSTRVTYVPLANRRGTAVLLTEDFERLRELGVTLNWWADTDGHDLRYVRCTMGKAGGTVTVARLITEAPRGMVVKYRDGNRLNLRRPNLYLVSGRAKEREAVLVEGLSHASLVSALSELPVAA